MFLEDGAPMGSRILLVEPEANEREKFRHIIAGTKHELLKDVGCGTEAMGALDEVYPDMVVMSIDTPRSKSDVERAGLKVILKILAKTSPPKVVMSYARGTEMLVVKAIQYGAAGAFERNDSRREVLEVLRKAEDHKPGIPPTRRKRVRFGVDLLAWYKKPGDSFFTRMRPTKIDDISGGGVRIHTVEQIPSETQVKIKLALPTSKKLIRAVAAVRWCKAEPEKNRWSMGLEFTKIADADRDRLEIYIQRLLASR
ncbi:MAG: hypothetical protein A3K18_33890 [Lentisphaerae bacterium RIFOXYA12_64_32]|nr:MAG: hypothetical protein A3K18_33890 [Lentisphaerae bacterium RIFOXYA12_64_32]